MTQEQVNVVDWLIEQMKQHRDVNSINPIELINLKYEAIKMYNEALLEELIAVKQEFKNSVGH